MKRPHILCVSKKREIKRCLINLISLGFDLLTHCSQNISGCHHSNVAGLAGLFLSQPPPQQKKKKKNLYHENYSAILLLVTRYFKVNKYVNIQPFYKPAKMKSFLTKKKNPLYHLIISSAP